MRKMNSDDDWNDDVVLPVWVVIGGDRESIVIVRASNAVHAGARSGVLCSPS